jgi:hypothetical protein
MSYNIAEDHVIAVKQYISQAKPSKSVDEKQFEALAKFIAVADELSHEPFFSKDNHDTIQTAGNEKPLQGRFGHPAFLKSAILPFRKLWMPSEPCHYKKVRDFVYDLFEGQQPVEGYRYAINDTYADTPHHISGIQKVKTRNDVLNIWINTQGAHTGMLKADDKQKDKGKFTLADFDEVNRLVGRAKFEHEFRSSLFLVGHGYLNFYRIIARPAFERLRALGFKPCFEVEAALRFNAYPRESDNIRLLDYFWHLDKETTEETFDRLLERNEFKDINSFFSGYFFARKLAFEALARFDTLDTLIAGTHGVLLTEPMDAEQLMSQFSVAGDFNNNGGRITVFEEKKILFEERSYLFLGYQYGQFRKAYLDHRAQVPEKFAKWKGNWHGL